MVGVMEIEGVEELVGVMLEEAELEIVAETLMVAL